MSNEGFQHLSDILSKAQNLMTDYFKKKIRFSKIIQISEPERRNLILRLMLDEPTSALPKSIILKKTVNESIDESEKEQLARSARDWAGVEFLTYIGKDHGPRFYAGDLEHKFILIENLGEHHPSLVGPLTRRASPTHQQEAKHALSSYMQRMGQMHADSFGKSSFFTAILNKIYPHALPVHYFSPTTIQSLLKQFKDLIDYESTSLQCELENINESPLQSGEFDTFIHGYAVAAKKLSGC
jgi:hypothetical protein